MLSYPAHPFQFAAALPSVAEQVLAAAKATSLALGIHPPFPRSLDPNDPQVRERQRTMDVDMAMQLSRARREIIPPVVEHEQPDSVFPQHELDIARGEPEEQIDNLVPIPTFVEMNHISAHDPSMLVHESQPPCCRSSSTFGGLPTYQPNASHSEFDFTPMDEFASAEKTLLNLASPKFSLAALRARTVAPDNRRCGRRPFRPRPPPLPPTQTQPQYPRPRHHRKGGGGKMAMFEGNTGDPPPSFTIDAAQTTTGIPASCTRGTTGRTASLSTRTRSQATIHARSLSELPAEGQSFTDLFSGVPPPREASASRDRPARPGPTPVVGEKAPRHSNHRPAGEHLGASDAESSTWWLDVQSPTGRRNEDAEQGKPATLLSVFSIHPLTTEDIQMEETREKIELFRNYYLVCFRSFDQDPYSPTHLEPLNMYIIVFREGTLSFHFRPTPHPQNVRRRIKQLKDYISVTSDWISYALIDDITDAFGPLIQGIEYEVDSIDELVLILKEAEQSDMLRRIGTCRKKVMGLLRLMGNKADVVKGLAKRCNEHWRVAPTSDIVLTLGQGLYLSDIQDHLITMTQNLNHYEKILSRSHSNYLAQISIEMTDANNQINDVLSKLTALGTVLIPMNLVTGLWGMNVHVPGQDVPVRYTSKHLSGSELTNYIGVRLVRLHYRGIGGIRRHRRILDV
ncbi:hypothetical protein B0H14DRAFT_3548343 [Mycena olivaceomarginata]|nr:hypothetical protein B0H14DRAFT_3548343 [Mycena olivaceomarginata]